MYLLLATTLLIAAIVAGYMLSRPSHEQLLSEARELELTDPSRALDLLESLTRASNGNSPVAQVIQCRILATRGRPDRAIASFQQIGNLADCPTEELVRLGRRCHDVGNDNLAEMALDAGGGSIRTKSETLRTLIEVKYALGRNTETLKLCTQYTVLMPDDPFPWLISASIYHQNEDRARAAHAYQEALARPLPTSEINRVRYQLVAMLMDLGDLKEARRQCDLLMATTLLDPNDRLSADLSNADLLQREGQTQRAMAAVEAVLAANPDSLQARHIRGFLYFESGDYSRAIDDLSLVVRCNPFNQPAHYQLGQAYLRAHQLDQAEVHLKRSQELVQLTSETLVTLNRLRNEPNNVELKLRLAELQEQTHGPVNSSKASLQGCKP